MATQEELLREIQKLKEKNETLRRLLAYERTVNENLTTENASLKSALEGDVKELHDQLDAARQDVGAMQDQVEELRLNAYSAEQQRDIAIEELKDAELENCRLQDNMDMICEVANGKRLLKFEENLKQRENKGPGKLAHMRGCVSLIGEYVFQYPVDGNPWPHP